MSEVSRIDITEVTDSARSPKDDLLVVEEPMEIRLFDELDGEARERSIAVTMRTPGQDLELALGFLFTEGIVTTYDDVAQIRHCEDETEDNPENIVKVYLQKGKNFDLEKLQRNFYTASSCGVCGKNSIDAIFNQDCRIVEANTPLIDSALIRRIPDQIRQKQLVFKHTGGLHGAAILSEDGKVKVLREDIGRHNAVDKVIGYSLFKYEVPLGNSMLYVSGRAGFELVQKAAAGGIPIMIAVGAPSTLAVETARTFNITLIGFASKNRFNIYSGAQRIK